MTQTTADLPTPPKPRKRGTRTDKPTALPGEHSFAPAMPTNGAEVMGAWSLPNDAWREARLKITRKQPMSNATELVAETTIEAYDLQTIARDFGPGDYYLYLGPTAGKTWTMHHCKVAVSQEYARAAGFGQFAVAQAPPTPRIADVAAYQAVASGLQSGAPPTMENLILLVNQTVRQTMKEMQDARPQAPPTAGGFDQALAVYGIVEQIRKDTETRTEDRILRILGDRETSAQIGDGDDFSIVALMKQLGPVLLQAMAPKPAPAPEPALAPEPTPTLPPPAEEPMQPNVPLTSNEASRFALAVGMLKRYVPELLELMHNNSNDADVAAELDVFIPAVMAPQLIELAELTENRGPGVLGIVDPRLATPRGASLIAALKAQLQS